MEHAERVRRAASVLLLVLPASGCWRAGAVPPLMPARPPVPLASLAQQVSAGQNRAVSFSNKDAAYYYTQTHRNDHPEHAWFRGLNIAGRRVFNDYRLLLRGAPLDPAGAAAVVTPDALVRSYPGGLTETLRLLDHRNVVDITLTGVQDTPLQLLLSGDRLKRAGSFEGLDRYIAADSGTAEKADHVLVGRRGERFLVAVDSTPAAARALWERTAGEAPRLEAERRARLEGLLNGDHYLWTDDPRLTASLRWIALTTDELVTRQRGAGIYAGLPWFNEYWGRDSFIALAGATLVTGQFEEARAILTSFAAFQELDPASPFYGRLPNIVKPGSIDYHTTDGTPRWVIALRDYLRYSGDRALVRQLYPNVRASIEGALAHWTDAAGYLVHAENETWMDARREADHAAYAPRSTRANDIQALWYEQLRAGAEFAATVGDSASAARWSAAAERLRTRFARDFVDPRTGRIADRLDERDRPDARLRPNLLFALELVPEEVAARATREAWERLVYPWGVATLDQRDPFFHPYHLAWEHYHKDEAYHNGTVWPWLNGIAMQRMLELGQVEPAWRLFRATGELVLERGAVGGLPETMDAYPHPGEAAPRLTGTFLQAWSNAEQLRVWYQDFLGIRPELAGEVVRLAPRLPQALGAATFTVRLGTGWLDGDYQRTGGVRRYSWRIRGAALALELDLAPFAEASFKAAQGDSLVAEVRQDGVHVRLISADGTPRESRLLPPSPERRAQAQTLDALFAGVEFAHPLPLDSHPVLRQVYRRP